MKRFGILSGDQDPNEAELDTIGQSLLPYLAQYQGQVGLNGAEKKVLKLAKKAAKAIAKVTKAKGKKIEKAKKRANKALDKFDAMIAPQPDATPRRCPSAAARSPRAARRTPDPALRASRSSPRGAR